MSLLDVTEIQIIQSMFIHMIFMLQMKIQDMHTKKK